MSIFRRVRSLLDPQQHTSLNIDFNLVTLPHDVVNSDLQTAQEWQQFLNECNDPGSLIECSYIIYITACSTTKFLPDL